METSSNSQAVAEPVSFKERIKLFLKFALVGFIFWYLFHKGLIKAESFKRLIESPGVLVACCLLMILNTLLGALRWRELLITQDAKLPFMRVLKLNLVGAFFNIALPGAVSGDFIKAIYVAKQFQDKRGAVFGSMLFDRILGVSAMALVGAFSAILSIFIPWGGHLPNALLISVISLGAGVAAFFIYLFNSHHRDPLFSLLKFFTKRHEKLMAVDKLYLGVVNYRKHPGHVLKAIGLSIFIHILIVTLAFFMTVAVSTQPIPFLALAVTVPIGILSTAVPVLPAGVGTGHAAFYALFKMIGSDQGAEIFSLIVLFSVLVGIIGGIVYLQVSSEK